jgi:hypothetical protein
MNTLLTAEEPRSRSNAWIVILAALIFIGTGQIFVHRKTEASRQTTEAAIPASTRRTNGQIAEQELLLEEAKCQGDFIGKDSPLSARRFCHDLHRSEWEQWALSYPELAQARNAIR